MISIHQEATQNVPVAEATGWRRRAAEWRNKRMNELEFVAYHQAAGFGEHWAEIAGRAVIYNVIGRLMHGLSVPALLLAVALALVALWLAGRVRRQW